MLKLSRLAAPLRRFRSDERGVIALETVIIFPMLVLVFLALFASFHAYRTYAVNQKAAYTIADMISRETNPIDAAYLDGARRLLRYMTNAELDAVSVRVTLVYWDADAGTYQFDWSAQSGSVKPITVQEVANWSASLPTLPDQERVIVVETFQDYDPPFDTGFSRRDVTNFIFTKPRYAPQILWEAAGV
jgi:Flp pilus assembly protein TadG